MSDRFLVHDFNLNLIGSNTPIFVVLQALVSSSGKGLLNVAVAGRGIPLWLCGICTLYHIGLDTLDIRSLRFVELRLTASHALNILLMAVTFRRRHYRNLSRVSLLLKEVSTDGLSAGSNDVVLTQCHKVFVIHLMF